MLPSPTFTIALHLNTDSFLSLFNTFQITHTHAYNPHIYTYIYTHKHTLSDTHWVSNSSHTYQISNGYGKSKLAISLHPPPIGSLDPCSSCSSSLSRRTTPWLQLQFPIQTLFRVRISFSLIFHTLP